MDNFVKGMLSNWLWISISMSIIWGLYGLQFVVGVKLPSPQKWFNKFFAYFYQFIVNFVGSFAGWCCFYILGNRYLSIEVGIRDINSIDFILFFLALLGITGHLYNVIIGIANAFVKLNELLVERLMQRR